MAEISICIPTFNGAQYLQDCLDSATNQTFKDLEIVVVDDKSSDETLELARNYAAFDRRIKIYTNAERLGLVGNWNQAIRMSTSPWIKLLFQDDFILPECTAELHAFAKRSGQRFIGCFREFLFEEGVSNGLRDLYLRNRTLVAGAFQFGAVMGTERCAELALDHFAENFVGEPTVTLLHRSVFETCGYFDPAMAQRCDIEFWSRVGTRWGIGMLDCPLAVFRVHPGSTTGRNRERRRFADEILDRVILLFRYVHAGEYSLVRQVAIQRGVFDGMRHSLGNLYWSAKRIAYEHRSNAESGIWEDWHRVHQFYPALNDISQWIEGGQ